MLNGDATTLNELRQRGAVAGGFLLEWRAKAQHSLACRFVAFRQLSLQPITAVLTAREATIVWIAFYSQEVLRNGWQPFDQPVSSAYLPIGYQDLDHTRLGDGGALLFQKSDRRVSEVLIRVRTSECHILPPAREPTEGAFARICEHAGLGPSDVSTAVLHLAARITRMNQDQELARQTSVTTAVA